MDRTLQRFMAFCEEATRSPVRVDIHLGDIEEEARIRESGRDPLNESAFAQKAVAFACALGAISVAASLAVQKPPEAASPTHSGPVLESPHHVQPLPQPPGKRLNYVMVNFAGKQMATLDIPSRLHLSKQAADTHDLHEVGLDWKDVYGVIHAETSWVARDGTGKNGVPSYGLAQLEPTTAASLQVDDPHDPHQAVDAAARLMKEAAQWSERRVKRLKLPPKEHAQALREGVSVYYNLSTAARHRWDGRNVHHLPEETQRHIKATREGAKDAAWLDAKLHKHQQREQARLQAAPTQPASPDFTPGHRAAQQGYRTVAMQFSGETLQPATVPAVSAVPDGLAKMRNILQRDASWAQLQENTNGLQAAPTSFKPFSAPAAGALLDAQFSQEHAQQLQQLQQVLKDPCAVQASPMSVVRYNSTCMMNAKLAEQQRPMVLNSVFPGAMMAGTFQGHPVMLVRDAGFMAAAGAYYEPGAPKEQMTVILVSTGVLEHLQGPLQKAALEFIMRHEVAHIGRGHLDSDDPAKTAQFEMEADAAAFDALKNSGMSWDDAADVAHVVFKKLREVISTQPDATESLAILDQRVEALEAAFDQWDRELSERGRVQFHQQQRMGNIVASQRP